MHSTKDRKKNKRHKNKNKNHINSEICKPLKVDPVQTGREGISPCRVEASAVATPKNKEPLINALQKKMEFVLSTGATNLPNTLLENLQKLINQEPISDVESSEDEDEYVEYVYKPRSYFAVSICNFCKTDLRGSKFVQCSKCKMSYYCSSEHMKLDQSHKPLCYGLQQVANRYGGHVFYNCKDFSPEQFRSYRIVTMRNVEGTIQRQLSPSEKEVILFPRICCDVNCREYRYNKLQDCKGCGQVAFCKTIPEHFPKTHHIWCKSFQLFKEIIMFQEKFGRIEPSLPVKILRDLPLGCRAMKQILTKLSLDVEDDECEFAALTQIATGPLSAWYAMRLCEKLRMSTMTIHLIGAELDFEVDLLSKWELFFMHITPAVSQLNVVFVGPELKSNSVAFEQLQKTKCCRSCRKANRSVQYHFECSLYHNYCESETFIKPDLICFFNPGLHHFTGFMDEDTWPETIQAAVRKNCPIIVTSYTQYEAPLDLGRFIQESNRHLDIVMPPMVNPFGSIKPERNFISEEEAPLMYKNYYCFVIE